MEAGQRARFRVTRAAKVRKALVGAALIMPCASSLALAGSESTPVVDLHVDLSYQLNYRDRPFARGAGQFPASELARGGVAGVVLPLFVPRKVSPSGPRAVDLERSYERVLSAIYETDEYAPPGCTPVAGKVRTLLAFEGAGPLADDPALLATWVARGLKVAGLVHTSANQLASSSAEQRPAFGLTPKGREFVRRAFALDIAVDVSHASDAAVRDVLGLAKEARGVVVATHSNARALADHPRNLTDAQIRAIAATGGVVGVNFHSPFLVRDRPAELGDVVAQVRHLLGVAGEDHVALGSDFEGDIRPPPGLAGNKDYPALEAALEKAGIARSTIAKVFFRNALRVLCKE
jgi:membrane dipeptidase